MIVQAKRLISFLYSKNWLLLLLILSFALFSKFYHYYPKDSNNSNSPKTFSFQNLNVPLTDLHAWRQADTAAVARNIKENNFNFMYPKIDSAVRIDGKQRDNLLRFHFAEFPIYQTIVAGVDLIFNDIVLSGRVVSVVSSLGSIVALFYLVKLFYSKEVALISTVIYAFLPYHIFWSRTVLPDMMMVFMVTLFLLFWCKWLESNSQETYFLVLAMFFFCLALLLKIFIAFLILPISYTLIKRFKLQIFKQKYLWLLGILSVLPFLFWRIWIMQYPAGIPASDWLFNGTGVRLKPAWWHWIFQTRLDQFMFNFSGLALIFIGLFFAENLNRDSENYLAKNYRWFWVLSFIGTLGYFVVLATGNVTHEYYQLPMTLFGSVLMGTGFWHVWSHNGNWLDVGVRRLGVIAFVGLTIMLGFYSVKDWYGAPTAGYVEVGRRADAILPKDAKVIADFGGNNILLFYVNRKGWGVREKQLDSLIEQGATHYVSLYRDDYLNKLARLYKVVDESPEYVILDLRVKTGNWSEIKRYEL